MSVFATLLKRLGFAKRPEAIRRSPQQSGQIRGFNAADFTRLTADWTTTSQTFDRMLQLQMQAQRARSEDLSINNDYAAKFLWMLKSNVLGDSGLQLKNKAIEDNPNFMGKGRPLMDERANRMIEDAWYDWGKQENCTVSGTLCWREVQEIALETIAASGEVFLKMHTPWDNKYKFALELIDPHLCDHRKNEKLADGGVIRLGVQMDKWRRPTAYWMFQVHPYDNLVDQSGGMVKPMSAQNIVHAFLRRRIAQSRGYTWLAVAMSPLNMLGGYEEAELVSSRVAAQKMMFFEQEGAATYQGDDDGLGNKIMESSPGGAEVLPQGLKLAKWDPQHPNSNYSNFVKTSLRRIAAGLGVSYNPLANDWEGVSFSSARLGMADERDVWRKLQAWYGETICSPIFAQFLRVALFNGAINLPMQKFDKFNSPTWIGRRWSWVDPVSDTKAIIQSLAAGLTSHTRVLAELGIDENELLEEIAAFKAKAESMGLNFEEVFPPEEPEPTMTAAPSDS